MINREDIKEGLKFCLPTAVSGNSSMVRINVELFNGKIEILEEHNNIVFTVESVDKILGIEVCTISYCRTDGGFTTVFFCVLLGFIMKNGEKVVSPQKECELHRDGDKGLRLLPKSMFRTERSETDNKIFRDIINGMYGTYKAKNRDYDNSFTELFEECGMTYAYGHMAEKLKRVKSLMSDEARVKGESMRDSLLDLANYAILTIMELDKTKK